MSGEPTSQGPFQEPPLSPDDEFTYGRISQGRWNTELAEFASKPEAARHKRALESAKQTHDFDDATSDLNFVVRFADRRNPNYVDRYLDFADALEALFDRDVDLVTERSLRSPLFVGAVERDRETIYERSGSEAAA